ncbi:MAG TPA: Gfo/Idh/MocA family oxidoreductase [Candidatus Bathyarchaeia archaeon]|nr:Gfo/Idh/MocA family oxidoreductase [Candidatus Bathyarchaeia archaeon]
MKAKAQVGIVGLGRMGKRHLEAYLRNHDVKIVACSDTNPDALKVLGSQGVDCKQYVDWREMLVKESLDLLSVVTNGPSHAEITIEAAKAKIPRILCEKPMATSIKDAKHMIDVTRANGTLLAINYSRRWSEDYQTLKGILRKGAIGDLCQIYCVCGGGQLACNGSHFLDLMRFLSSSEPASVIGFVDKRGTPNPRGSQFVDPGAFGLITFQNGVRGFIDMYEDLGVPPRIEVVGNIGRVVIDETRGSWIMETREGKDREDKLGRYDLPLIQHSLNSTPLDPLLLVERTIREILASRPLSCTGTDGLAAVEMVIGLHASDREGHLPLKMPLAEKYEEIAVNFT